ncbi:MAG: cell envelope integrity protein TolA, partial [Candidatus Parabeggiatoa sp.]|nr:cell envelope integrity protein TolA [Candidatus Parabeggiatoa sp.]
MWDNIISFIDAIIIHTLLLAIVFFSIDLPDESLLTSSAPENTIQAVALDEQQVLATISRWENEQVIENKALRAQQQALEQKKRDIQKTVLKETQSLEQLQKQKDAEQQRLADIEQQQLLETLALEELKYEKAQEEARLAREADAKRQAAELARLTQEAEEQIEEEDRPLPIEDNAIEQQPLADKKWETTAATRQSQNKKRLQKITLQLQKKILQQWIRPRYGYYTGLSCVIEIRLKPGGVINEVNIIKSSGNLVFDHSAISAIHEASPLRIPHDLFEAFQHFYFTFK